MEKTRGFPIEARAFLSVSPSPVCVALPTKKRKILLEIGNRYDNNLQFIVVERIRRYGSYYI